MRFHCGQHCACLRSSAFLSLLLTLAIPAIAIAAQPPRALLPPSIGTSEETFVLTGRSRGHALFRAARIIQRGDLLLSEAQSRFEGALTNHGAIEIRETRVDVQGPVMNHGSLKVTDAEVHYESVYTEYGAYESDPSDNYFTDLVIGTSGYLVGGPGDRFFVSGDLVSSSTNNTNWSTGEAELHFRTGVDTLHSLSLTGIDYGPVESGYTQNYAWGRLEIVAGNSLTLVDGNATAGGAFYTREMVGAQISGSTVTNITGAASLVLYYDPAEAANAYLADATYDLTGDGQLVPLGAPAVPMLGPLARLLLLAGMAGLGARPLSSLNRLMKR